MEIQTDRPGHGVQPGQFLPDHLQRRQRPGSPHYGTLPGRDQHPDHDHHANGLQTPRIPRKDRQDQSRRMDHRHARRRDRAADTVHIRLFLKLINTLTEKITGHVLGEGGSVIFFYNITVKNVEI